MARKKELTTVADKLEHLEELQTIHSKIDAIHILKGELPIEVADLEDEIAGTEKRVAKINVEIEDAKEEIEHRKTLMKEAQSLITKYDKQLHNVKNNREFDALNKEIELQKLEIQLVEEKLLSAYTRIRKSYRNGLAVVLVARNACGGCFGFIPPQTQSEIRTKKKISTCEHCGRILAGVDDSAILLSEEEVA